MRTVEITELKDIESIIKRCKVCYVGLADTDGTPYVLPMNFGYRDKTVYLHSAQTGRVIDILQRNPKVCITFSIDHALVFQHPEVACSYRMKSKSVISWGNVEFIDEFEAKIEILNILMGQYSEKEFVYSDPAVRNVKIWKVNLDQITCKVFGAPHKGNPI